MLLLRRWFLSAQQVSGKLQLKSVWANIYKLPEDFQQFWDKQLYFNDFKLLPVSIAHTSLVAELPYHHRDPFDRLIIAQSLVEMVPVVSSDTMFDSYTGVKRIW